MDLARWAKLVAEYEEQQASKPQRYDTQGDDLDPLPKPYIWDYLRIPRRHWRTDVMIPWIESRGQPPVHKADGGLGGIPMQALAYAPSTLGSSSGLSKWANEEVEIQ